MGRDPEEIDRMIDELVEVGALVPRGMFMDDITYTVVPEILKVYSPELYDMYMEELDETLIELVKRDLVSVEYDEQLTPRFSLTEAGKKVANDLIIGYTDHLDNNES